MGKTDIPTIAESARKSEDDIMRMVGHLLPRKLGDSLRKNLHSFVLVAQFPEFPAKGRGQWS